MFALNLSTSFFLRIYINVKITNKNVYAEQSKSPAGRINGSEITNKILLSIFIRGFIKRKALLTPIYDLLNSVSKKSKAYRGS